jgi:DNA-3-methyladenine glycosylase II
MTLNQEKHMARITSRADIAEGLTGLLAADVRLVGVRAIAGEIPLRLRPPGFEGLARIVVSQHVSVASAQAIWDRLETRLRPFTPAALCACRHLDLRADGLSGAKIRTLRAMCEAIADGLDLQALDQVSADEAHGRLIAIKGIGPWTADVFLMFCLGHADAFAAGDVALQNAARDAFDLEDRPSAGDLLAIAEAWRPWRAVAARLLWAYYRARREGSETLPL